MIEISFGRPGNGKTLYMCYTLERLCKRAVRIKKKYGLDRKVYVNIPISSTFKEKYPDIIQEWEDPYTLITKRDIDILWDEIAVDFPAASWANTPRDMRDFFAQHRHLGIEIYANTQDYLDVDINVRRRVKRALLLRKLVGSRDPSATLPPVKHVWGLIIGRTVDPQQAEDTKEIEMDIFDKLIPREMFFIKKHLVDMWDMRHTVKHHEWEFKHSVRVCKICGYEKVMHT